MDINEPRVYKVWNCVKICARANQFIQSAQQPYGVAAQVEALRLNVSEHTIEGIRAE